MDTELEPTIAALQSNVLACREVADLALLSAEQLEQLAHVLEREAWHARLRSAASDGAESARLTESERRLVGTLTQTCAAWVRLMRVYCRNVEAAFEANPRLAAALPPELPLHALASFWAEADERLKRLLQPPVERPGRVQAPDRQPALPTVAAAAVCSGASPVIEEDL